jgi:ribosomal-protein-alanine N-acetyltransferase
VRETNLQAQLFFKAVKFTALRVLRDHFDDTGESAYLMRYRLPMSEWARENLEEGEDEEGGSE